jgi:molybdopterin/thiamine biosynthesis adenylyltransferase
VGEFVLLDPDRVEDTNLNRLVGATDADVRKSTEKAAVATRVISSVNPYAVVVARAACWQECSDLLKECDVVFSCLDTLIARDEIESLTRRYLIPLIDIGMDVHTIGGEFAIAGQVAMSVPDGPCLRCMGILTESGMRAEAEQYGEAGPRPQVVWPNAILASTAVGCLMQMTTPWQFSRPASVLLEYDGNAQTVQSSAKLPHLPTRCGHYTGIENLGDPFWCPESDTDR